MTEDQKNAKIKTALQVAVHLLDSWSELIRKNADSPEVFDNTLREIKKALGKNNIKEQHVPRHGDNADTFFDNDARHALQVIRYEEEK